MPNDHAWVLNGRDSSWLAVRTARAFEQFGITTNIVTMEELRRELSRSLSGWIALAGSIPVRLPKVGVGDHHPAITLAAECHESGEITDEWRRWFSTSSNRFGGSLRLPSFTIGYIRDSRAIGAALAANSESLLAALEACSNSCRIEAASGLRALRPLRPRVAYLIGTLHKGGAERVVIDLHQETRQSGWDSRLYVLYRPKRQAYGAPEGSVLIYDLPNTGSATALEVAGKEAALWGADVLSVHLLDERALATLRSAGHHIIPTLHNDRQGWPNGYDSMDDRSASLFICCSTRVTREFASSQNRRNVRTAWNGVRAAPAIESDRRRQVRERLGIADDTIIVLAISNARPQKQLHLLPKIASELRARRSNAAIVHIGDLPNAALPETLDCNQPNASHPGLIFAGFQDNSHEWLAASDVYLSVSAHEGLSIAQLEAISLGVPLVITDTAGTEELIRWTGSIAILPQSATPADFSIAILEQIERPYEARRYTSPPSPRDCAARYARLFERSLAMKPTNGRSLLLVSNDLQTGGAQSSLRRFAREAAKYVERVAILLIFDDPSRVVERAAELERSAVTVLFVPREAQCSGRKVANCATRLIDEFNPSVLTFWNANVEVKLRIADCMPNRKIFDVSPGEMFYEEFRRYFARPRPDLPFLSPADYGAILSGLVIKHSGELTMAVTTLNIQPTVIHNGVFVNNGCIDTRNSPDPATRTKVGTLVRINPDKRLEELFAGMRHLQSLRPDVTLCIGGGPDPGYEQYAQDLMLSAGSLAVTWLGEVEPRDLFSQIDLFVLIAEPAGFPNASLEAMAYGLPVVATDCGGMREQIQHGLNGWLAQRGNAEDLGRLIADALDNPDRLLAAGKAGREIARHRFSVRHMAERYLKRFGLENVKGLVGGI